MRFSYCFQAGEKRGFRELFLLQYQLGDESDADRFDHLDQVIEQDVYKEAAEVVEGFLTVELFPDRCYSER
jgi:hypothetical protein